MSSFDNPMTREVITILVITFLVLLVDGTFIQFVMKPHWVDTVRAIQKTPFQIRTHHAVFAYITMVIGMYWFIWRQLSIVHTEDLDETIWRPLIGTSLLWGFVTYGIFDFTVGALFQDYPEWLLATDILWGMTMTSIVMSCTYLFIRNLYH